MKRLIGWSLLVLVLPATAISSDETVMFNDGMPGRLFLPSSKSVPHPSVVMAHGRRAMDEDLQELASSLRERGIAVLLLPPIDSRPDDLSRIARAFDLLRKRPDVDDTRLAIVGFCGGGYQALLWAGKSPPGLVGAVVFYGPLEFPEEFQPDDGARFESALVSVHKIDVPLLAHYGAADHIIPLSDVRELETRMSEAEGDLELFIYEEAGHGFWDHAHGHFIDGAAELAERRTFKFLEQVFTLR